jgi:hypothetical protein
MKYEFDIPSPTLQVVPHEARYVPKAEIGELRHIG